MSSNQKAVLYRMVLPDHTCPFGVRAKALLDEHGYETEEHVLTSRDEVDSFEAKEGVSTTPQVYIDGERIGGCDELERFLAGG